MPVLKSIQLFSFVINSYLKEFGLQQLIEAIQKGYLFRNKWYGMS